MEGLQRLHLLAGADELDRRTADLADREGGATAGIAIEFGEHGAGDSHLLVEGAGEIGGLLANHRIHHQQHLVGLHGIADPHHLLHHRGIDLQPAGGIHQHRVVALLFGLAEAGGGDLLGLGLRAEAEYLHTDLGAQGFELIDGGRPIHVGGHQQRLAALLLEVQPQLGGGGGFASPLQAGHQHHAGTAGFAALGQGGIGATHGLHQLFVHHLDELLVGADPPHHLRPEGLAPHLINEILHHRQAHIGLQQGAPHVLQGRFDVGFTDGGLTPEGLDGVIEALGQFVEHRGLLAEGRPPRMGGG